MPRTHISTITKAQAESASVPSIYIGELATDETGVLWIGQPDGTWERVGSAANYTPHQLGTIGASVTLPLADHVSIEGSVGSEPTVAVTLPAADVGTRSTVLLTATADCTVQLPTLHWLAPLGSVWSGAMLEGQSVRLSFVRSSLGWEAVDARLSTTAIPVVTEAADIAFDSSGADHASGPDVQSAIESLDSAIDSITDDLYGERVTQNVTGSVTLNFSEYRNIEITQTGVATITLTAPPHPKTVHLDVNPAGFARAPQSPEALVDALQDPIHRVGGKVRVAKSVRVQGGR